MANPLNSYVNHGRWVADCECGGGGVLTDPTQSEVFCGACGRTSRVTHPSSKLIGEAWPLLLLRPVENRNWFPERESVEDLRRENAEHGLEEAVS